MARGKGLRKRSFTNKMYKTGMARGMYIAGNVRRNRRRRGRRRFR